MPEKHHISQMTIGIIGAMKEEIDFIRNQMQVDEVINIAGHIFYIGPFQDKQIVLLQCGIGKVNAAIGTTLLIERFSPDYMINTGVAGGLHMDLEVGDVIISIEVRHHDVDLTVWGYEHGQLPKLPAAFLASQILTKAAETAAHQLDMNVTFGLIVSGDCFIHEAHHIENIREKFSDAHAVEMEAAAIAQVCHQFDRPFVIIRAVSDMVGKDSPLFSDLSVEERSHNCAQLVMAMVQELR